MPSHPSAPVHRERPSDTRKLSRELLRRKAGGENGAEIYTANDLAQHAPVRPQVVLKKRFVRWLKMRQVVPLRGSALFTQTESFDNLAIPIRVAPVQIVQQSSAPVDHHDQPAA
jgi:hypothetical protein